MQLPANSRKVDYEAEVAFVVGRRAKDVAEAEALDYVAGYTLLNDLSARDLQFSTPQWMSGKVFDGSAPCGPALVTPDEAGPHDAIEIRLTLNGEQMQGASTADLIFSVPGLLSHLSRLMTLEPGRHRLHRHPGGGRQRPRPAGLARRRRRDRDRVPHPGPARDAHRRLTDASAESTRHRRFNSAARLKGAGSSAGSACPPPMRLHRDPQARLAADRVVEAVAGETPWREERRGLPERLRMISS